MKKIDLNTISLYDLKESCNEETLIGDFRHTMWKRFATKALSLMVKNPKLRPYAFEVSNMIKANNINGEMLSVIIEDVENVVTTDEEIEVMKILAAIRNI